jgi:hypothetical protein
MITPISSAAVSVSRSRLGWFAKSYARMMFRTLDYIARADSARHEGAVWVVTPRRVSRRSALLAHRLAASEMLAFQAHVSLTSAAPHRSCAKMARPSILGARADPDKWARVRIRDEAITHWADGVPVGVESVGQWRTSEPGRTVPKGTPYRRERKRPCGTDAATLTGLLQPSLDGPGPRATRRCGRATTEDESSRRAKRPRLCGGSAAAHLTAAPRAALSDPLH